MNGEVWQATVHEVAKSRTQLSDFTHSPTRRPSIHFIILSPTYVRMTGLIIKKGKQIRSQMEGTQIS